MNSNATIIQPSTTINYENYQNTVPKQQRLYNHQQNQNQHQQQNSQSHQNQQNYQNYQNQQNQQNYQSQLNKKYGSSSKHQTRAHSQTPTRTHSHQSQMIKVPALSVPSRDEIRAVEDKLDELTKKLEQELELSAKSRSPVACCASCRKPIMKKEDGCRAFSQCYRALKIEKQKVRENVNKKSV